MNVKPVFFTPKNDEELNAYIDSINDSYAKGFGFYVGPKRSENLRDVICSHLGFPNGYQQLKSYWANQGAYDVLGEPSERGLMIYADIMGEAPVAVVFNEIAPWLLDKLRELFPCTENGFDREGEEPILGRSGWSLSAFPLTSQHELVTWVPLYVGTVQIGYANAYRSRHRAMLMQAMVTGVHMHIGDEMRESLCAPINEDWQSYVSKHQIPAYPYLDKAVFLSMGSMPASLIIPIEGNASITCDEFKFKTLYSQKDGAEIVKSCHIDAQKSRADDTLFLDGLEFDFVNVYCFSTGEKDTFNIGYSRTPKNKENEIVDEMHAVDALYWCERGRVKARKDDDICGFDLSNGGSVKIM
tara:strand:- start:1102 stop:2169 length:1068 start_codon:yes stop_codon:yes gene_type:complete